MVSCVTTASARTSALLGTPLLVSQAALPRLARCLGGFCVLRGEIKTDRTVRPTPDLRVGLATTLTVHDNTDMELQGRVHNGVVVVNGGLPLPEGTVVTVVCPAGPTTAPSATRRRVVLPLVPSEQPASRQLTAERVAETPRRRRCFSLTSICGWRCLRISRPPSESQTVVRGGRRRRLCVLPDDAARLSEAGNQPEGVRRRNRHDGGSVGHVRHLSYGPACVLLGRTHGTR